MVIALPRTRERLAFVRVEVVLDDGTGPALKIRQVHTDTDEVRKASILGIGPRDIRQEKPAPRLFEYPKNDPASDQARVLVELVSVVVDDAHELTDVAHLTDVVPPEQIGHVHVRRSLKHVDQLGLGAPLEHIVPVESLKEQSNYIHHIASYSDWNVRLSHDDPILHYCKYSMSDAVCQAKTKKHFCCFVAPAGLEEFPEGIASSPATAGSSQFGEQVLATLKNPILNIHKGYFQLHMPPAGLEPATFSLKGNYSTN